MVSHTSNGSTVENSRGRCLPLRQSLMRCGEIDIPAAEHPDDAARNVGLPARTNSRASASPNAASPTTHSLTCHQASVVMHPDGARTRRR